MADLVGHNLGPYRVLEQIGLGGMATVYKAYHAAMNRYVAVKVLPQHLARDPSFRARFQREARTIAGLEHRYILPVYDVGEEDGIPYLVMRYTDSGDLSDLIATQALTIARAAWLISHVAEALAYAHRRRVIHRDVKPANVLLSRDGDVLLTDFGIAKIYEETLQLTGEGNLIGTPAYMAPEQLQGKPVDARTDIYALGVVLYQALTGEPPFMAETPLALALMHIHNPLRPPRQLNPNIPEALERIVLRAMAKNPDDRFQTADEMAEALRDALADLSRPTAMVTVPATASPESAQATPAAPTPASAAEPVAAQPPGASHTRRWLAGAAVVALTVVLAVFLLPKQPSTDKGPPSRTAKPTTLGGAAATSNPMGATDGGVAATAAPTAEATVAPATATAAPAAAGSGEKLVIVSSLPRIGPSKGQTDTIVNAIKQRLEEDQNQACGGKFSIEFRDWDDATAAKGQWDEATEASNANKAAADPDVMLYIGTFNSSAAKISIPILNVVDLVMISPANTYPGLTTSVGAEQSEPYKYYPTRQRNYTRVVPNDNQQGVAGATWARQLGAKTVFILDDTQRYGKNTADMFEAKAKEIGLHIVGREGIDGRAANYRTLAAKIVGLKPDLVYFGGLPEQNVGQLWKDIRGAGYTGKMMGPDSIKGETFLEVAGADAAEGTYVTSSGVAFEQLTGKGADWYKNYKAKFNAEPESFAIYGYEAANVALAAINQVCEKNRAKIRDAVFATKDFDGVLGKWSFDQNGDTTLPSMSGFQVKSGKFEFVQAIK